MSSSSKTDDFDIQDFLSSQGLYENSAVTNIRYPWMDEHDFVVLKTADEVEKLVDECIEHGQCALDLEAQGLDTRIDYDENGNPHTRSKIVGYCIASDGKTGYYIPVRHKTMMGDDTNPNVDDVARTEEQIKRLCLAAQPVLPKDTNDPLGSPHYEKPPQVVIYFWNAKFDQELLLPVTGLYYWHPDSFEDFMLAYYVYNTSDKSLGLKAKSKEMLKSSKGDPYQMIELKELFVGARKIAFDEIYPDEDGVRIYAGSDAICTRLHRDTPIVKEVLTNPKYKHTYRLEKQTVQAVRELERNRVLIDRPAVMRLREDAEAEMKEYEDKIKGIAASYGFNNFNPDSGKQLSEFLFTEKGLDIHPKPSKLEKSGVYKTDATTLESLVDRLDDKEDNVLVWVVKHRQIRKILGTYVKGMLENTDEHNQMRFNFNQIGAATGRFTAPGKKNNVNDGYSGIPIHGIPARNDPKKPACAQSMRSYFIAHDGYVIVKNDYSGQELRIATNVSGEPVWRKEFLHGSGDLHTITAKAFFGKDKVTKEERAVGKRANFALIYGGGPMAIVRASGCSKMEGKRRKQAFDKSVPTFAKWVRKQHVKVKSQLGVYTAFGRWIAIPDANSEDDSVRAACERYSTNYPIQGSGADIMKISLVKVYKYLHRHGLLPRKGDLGGVRMILTVHDEIVFEMRKDIVQKHLPKITEIMESAWKLPKNPPWQVPLVVEPDIDLSWKARYPWNEIVYGREAKPGEVPEDGFFEQGGRIYMRGPDWLEEIITRETDGEPKKEHQEAQQQPVVDAVIEAPDKPKQQAKPKRQKENVVTYMISQLTETTVKIVAVVCMIARPMKGNAPVLQLVDLNGNVLIDPSLGIHIDPDVFTREMLMRNLGSGELET